MNVTQKDIAHGWKEGGLGVLPQENFDKREHKRWKSVHIFLLAIAPLYMQNVPNLRNSSGLVGDRMLFSFV